jgi:hypothetical protein
MSYNTIYRCAHDQAFMARVESACAQEGEVTPNASMFKVIYPVSTAADIEAAYASALAAENPNPGGDESVITDQMILSHVQPLLPVQFEPAPTPPA